MWAWGTRFSAAALVLGLTSACSFDRGGQGIAFADDDHDAASDAAPGATDAPPATPDAAAGIPQGTVDALFDNAIELDGDLADWADTPFQAFDMASCDHSHQPGASAGYAPSAAVRFAVAYDATRILFAVEVDDDIVSTPPEEPEDSYRLWNDDSISLYLDFAGDATGPYGDDDVEIVIATNGWYGQSPQTPHLQPTFELRGTVAPRPNGYAMEFAIMKSSLPVTPGNEIGFSIGVNDSDGMRSDGYDAIGVWYRAPHTDCPSCCSDHPDTWCDTNTLGRLRFR
jgi:hypothetical protein